MLEKLQQIREDKAADDRGFTLIELLVVVVIIGVLIAIAIPLYLNYTSSSKNASADSDVRNAVPVVQQYLSDKTTLPASADNSTGPGTAISFGTGYSINTSSNVVLYYVNNDATVSGNYWVCSQQGSGQIYVYNNKGNGQTGKAKTGDATIADCVSSGS